MAPSAGVVVTEAVAVLGYFNQRLKVLNRNIFRQLFKFSQLSEFLLFSTMRSFERSTAFKFPFICIIICIFYAKVLS